MSKTTARMTLAGLAIASAVNACSAETTLAGPNYVIFDASKERELLAQCSRRAPSPGDGSWMPSPRDIAQLEDQLPAALAPGGRTDPDLTHAPQGWLRQYVGIIRGGRRSIYGNFFRASYSGNDDKWRTLPLVACDGGRTFFGVEYDAEAHTIVDVEFNGDV